MKKIFIKLPNGNFCSLDELQKDVEASKEIYSFIDDFSFTAHTVQGLLDKIKDLSKELEQYKDYSVEQQNYEDSQYLPDDYYPGKDY